MSSGAQKSILDIKKNIQSALSNETTENIQNFLTETEINKYKVVDDAELKRLSKAFGNVLDLETSSGTP